MLYGLHYAVFVEHQALDRMGSSLAGAFANAAERHWDDSQSALIAYRETKYDYVRQVDVHSHWIGLAMLMIVLGVVFDEVAFGDRVRFLIALAMLAGSIVFPLGVILQTERMVPLGSALAILGSALVILALGVTAVGFMRGHAT
jgi:low temperature requirement protein LtrA